MTHPRRHGGARRARRSRPLPQWLRQARTSNPIALARCLLLLRVLSGAEPVTQAIALAKISRPTYYWLERKGLEGMLRALTPVPSRGRQPRVSPVTAHLTALEEKVQRLEQAKRRAERLVHLTRTVLPRVRRRRRGSTPSGPRPLRASATGRTRPRPRLIPGPAAPPTEPTRANS
jgi:hypothetical protein